MSYNIAGKAVPSEYLVIGIFSAIGGGAYLATRKGGDAKAQTKAPAPITASSPDEEGFIKQFIAEAQHEEVKK
ncbi:hypothetical protein MVES1_001666 [Malassezia vespertilionis]|uniref:uncharacterized protein n=1 Tax=Malassezia vespertilionis TaxID=2020962 RepID=UPI0024B03FAD|nr:uncharacterized protein MVES1_001666 [Malassezia vespertilionis]WFD06321.1 hypothetical protein MVES1_001666 [Malassezia vespertilionis]